MSSHIFERIEKVNFAEMTDVALAKWLHGTSKEGGKHYELNLLQALNMVKVLRIVYSLGEARGRALK